jgi:hypothetical protein
MREAELKARIERLERVLADLLLELRRQRVVTIQSLDAQAVLVAGGKG